MDNLTSIRSAGLPRWRELVQELLADIEPLVRTFESRLREIESYGANVVSWEDVHHTAHASFTLILESVIAKADDREIEDDSLPDQLGRTRARQGVPVEDLVAAVRLDFEVIWSSLLANASRADFEVLALHVDRLWSVVDGYARRTHRSYLLEHSVIEEESRDRERVYLSRLFTSDGDPQTNAAQVAGALGIDPDATFNVCAVGPSAAGRLRSVSTGLNAAGIRLMVFDRGHSLVAFWPTSVAKYRTGTGPQLAALRDVTCGLVTDVQGLSAVPKASDWAFEITMSLSARDHGPMTAFDVWPRIARTALHGVADHLNELLVRQCTARERERLLETVRQYLLTGNVAEVSARTYCHRNTVLNRLSRFREICGLDLNLPAEAAFAYVTLFGQPESAPPPERGRHTALSGRNAD